MSIGNIIKTARKNKGYTQEELGIMLGVGKSTISKYELGHIENVKRTSLQKLAQILEIEPHRLIDDFADDPIKKATEAGNIIFNDEVMGMVNEYMSLSPTKQAQAREYIHLLTLA